MRIPTQQRSSSVRFNVTPLIDIVFLLIIFFLVSTHFVRSETSVAIELPVASQSQEEPQERIGRLVVTIDADQSYVVGTRAVDMPEIERLIFDGAEQNSADANPGTSNSGDFYVRIRGDRSVPYRLVEPIMVACARAGVSKVRFAVIAK